MVGTRIAVICWASRTSFGDVTLPGLATKQDRLIRVPTWRRYFFDIDGLNGLPFCFWTKTDVSSRVVNDPVIVFASLT